MLVAKRSSYPVSGMRVARSLNPLPFLLLFFGALLTLCAWLSGGPTEILGTLPAILLAVALAFNRYPGEELIARLAERFQRPRPRPASFDLPAQFDVAAIRKTLLLLADSRQLRAPPRLSSLSI
jgi:hypothetical protein